MRKYLICSLLLIAFVLAGCSSDTKRMIQTAAVTVATNNIQNGSHFATNAALAKFGVNSPNAVKQAATDLNASIPAIQKYFDGTGTLPLAQDVNLLIGSKLTSKLDPALRDDIQAVVTLGLSAFTIDPKLPITATEIVIIHRMLAGIQDGANQYLGNVPVPIVPAVLTTP